MTLVNNRTYGLFFFILFLLPMFHSNLEPGTGELDLLISLSRTWSPIIMMILRWISGHGTLAERLVRQIEAD
jgi:hypothetical protein